MFNKLLVATDGSEDSIRAGEVAAGVAAKFGSEVLILTVCSTVMASGDTGAYCLPPDAICEAQTSNIACIAKIFDDLGLAFVSRYEYGNPADRIISVAEQEHCSLIVVGSHGVGGLRRFLLGSISDRVSHYAHCAVMIVKPSMAA